jgi:hypothetical protein
LIKAVALGRPPLLIYNSKKFKSTMTWKVSVRNGSGGRSSIFVEARNKSELFSELAKKSINAIAVEPLRINKSHFKKAHNVFLACIILLGLVSYIIFNFILGDISKKESINIQIATNKEHTKCANGLQNIKTSINKQNNKIEEFKKFKIGDFKTNLTRRIRYILDPKDPSQFGNIEQITGALLSTPLGAEPIPFPYQFDPDGGVDEFMKSLSLKIVATTNDTETRIQTKLEIAEVKLEMLELIKAGETPQTIIEEAYKMRIAAAKLRNEMIDDVRNWVVENNPNVEQISEIVNKFNDRLKKDGILEINIDDIIDSIEESNK